MALPPYRRPGSPLSGGRKQRVLPECFPVRGRWRVDGVPDSAAPGCRSGPPVCGGRRYSDGRLGSSVLNGRLLPLLPGRRAPVHGTVDRSCSRRSSVGTGQTTFLPSLVDIGWRRGGLEVYSRVLSDSTEVFIDRYGADDCEYEGSTLLSVPGQVAGVVPGDDSYFILSPVPVPAVYRARRVPR